MSRFFKTGNATRPYKAGRAQFKFEPLIYDNGTWLGVLAEGDEGRAETLANFGPPVSEITEAEFLELKKKPKTSASVSESKPEPIKESSTTGNAPDAVDDLSEELQFRKVEESSESKPKKKAAKKKAAKKKAAPTPEGE